MKASGQIEIEYLQGNRADSLSEWTWHEVIETDIGDRIIQIAGHRPPCHCTRVHLPVTKLPNPLPASQEGSTTVPERRCSGEVRHRILSQKARSHHRANAISPRRSGLNPS